MPSSLALVVAAQAAYAIVLGAVGFRLLRLAARTKETPELALGVGFAGAIFAIPLLGLSGFGRGTVEDVRFPLLAVALFLTWMTLSALSSFTWRAFRPHARWAAALTGGLSLLAASVVVSIWHGVTNGQPGQSSLDAAGRWVLGMRLPLVLGLVWTGIEAFRQHGMAKRRLAIGLGDPVVANRFLLWGWISVFALGDSALATWLQAQGRGPSNDPTAAILLAIGGGVSALMVALVFLPPEAWVRFVRARATAQRQT